MEMAAWGGGQTHDKPLKRYWDNVTGLPLVAWRVEKARKEEEARRKEEERLQEKARQAEEARQKEEERLQEEARQAEA